MLAFVHKDQEEASWKKKEMAFNCIGIKVCVNCAMHIDYITVQMHLVCSLDLKDLSLFLQSIFICLEWLPFLQSIFVCLEWLSFQGLNMMKPVKSFREKLRQRQRCKNIDGWVCSSATKVIMISKLTREKKSKNGYW